MTRFAKHAKVLKRLGAQAWGPCLFAVVYALWDFFSTQADSRTISGLVKSWGIAFFLIMWFVGQWFRAEKQISDAEQLSTIQADVAAIRGALALRGQPPAAPGMPEPISDSVANTLYGEARAAMDAGLTHSALLTAGVALEHVLRNFAESHNIVETKRLTIPRLLERIRSIVSPSVTEELAALWRVRNAVAHARDEQQFLEPQKARQLLESFGWAIRFLSNRDGGVAEEMAA
jgi:hypothetical protein